MTKLVFVRPAPAPTKEDPDAVRRIRDPIDGQPLPVEGRDVAWSIYWARRERDGDILIGSAPAPKTPKTPSEA